MTSEIKQKIEQIRNGEVPKGYKRTRAGIMPCDWCTQKEYKAKDVFYSVSNKNHNGDYEVLSATQDRGVIPRSQVDIDIKYDDANIGGYKMVDKGDFVISLRSFQGGIEYSEYTGLVSPAYTVLKPRASICDEYYKSYFKTNDFISRLNKGTYGIRDGKQVGFKDFGEMIIHFPPLPEQQRIAKILSAQDKVIECYEKKIEQLKRMKKYYLQNMFPKRGESVPKIRFKGFTDPWGQRKLGECVEFLDAMRKPLKEGEREKGIYPYYGASGIVDYISNYIFDEELVLLSEDGANITDRNYPVCFLASGKYWVNNHAHVLRVYEENENNFICNSLERMDFTKYNSGMAMPKLNKDVCYNIPLLCPIYEEQKQIGDYFRIFDNIITLHQRKLEEEKKKKKALQQLFLTGIVRINHE